MFGGKNQFRVLVVWRLRRHSGVQALAVKGSVFIFSTNAHACHLHMLFVIPLSPCCPSELSLFLRSQHIECIASSARQNAIMNACIHRPPLKICQNSATSVLAPIITSQHIKSIASSAVLFIALNYLPHLLAFTALPCSCQNSAATCFLAPIVTSHHNFIHRSTSLSLYDLR